MYLYLHMLFLFLFVFVQRVFGVVEYPFSETVNDNTAIYFTRIIGEIKSDMTFIDIQFPLAYDTLFGEYRKYINPYEEDLTSVGDYNALNISNINFNNASTLMSTSFSVGLSDDATFASVAKKIQRSGEITYPVVAPNNNQSLVKRSTWCIGFIYSHCPDGVSQEQVRQIMDDLNEYKKLQNDVNRKVQDNLKVVDERIKSNSEAIRGTLDQVSKLSEITKQSFKDLADQVNDRFKSFQGEVTGRLSVVHAHLASLSQNDIKISESVSRMLYRVTRAINLVGDAARLFGLAFDDVNYLNTDVTFVMCYVFGVPEYCVNGNQPNKELRTFLSGYQLAYESMCKIARGLAPLKPCELVGVTQKITFNHNYNPSSMFGKTTQQCAAEDTSGTNACYPYVFTLRIPILKPSSKDINVYEAIQVKAPSVKYNTSNNVVVSYVPDSPLPTRFRFTYDSEVDATGNKYIHDYDRSDLEDDAYGASMYYNQIRLSRVIPFARRRSRHLETVYKVTPQSGNFGEYILKYGAKISGSIITMEAKDMIYYPQPYEGVSRCVLPPEVAKITECQIAVWSQRNFSYILGQQQPRSVINGMLTIIDIDPSSSVHITYTTQRGTSCQSQVFETYYCPPNPFVTDVAVNDMSYKKVLAIASKELNISTASYYELYKNIKTSFVPINFTPISTANISKTLTEFTVENNNLSSTYTKQFSDLNRKQEEKMKELDDAMKKVEEFKFQTHEGAGSSLSLIQNVAMIAAFIALGLMAIFICYIGYKWYKGNSVTLDPPSFMIKAPKQPHYTTKQDISHLDTGSQMELGERRTIL